MRRVFFLLVFVLGMTAFANTPYIDGEENLVKNPQSQYVGSGYRAIGMYIPVNHTLRWSYTGPYAVLEQSGDPAYIWACFYSTGYYTLLARPYNNSTGVGAVGATINVIVTSSSAFVVPTDIQGLMLSNVVLLARK